MPPDTATSDGSGTQVGMALGEIKTDVSWIKSTLERVLPDLDGRLRSLEVTRAEDRGGRDTLARVLAFLAAAAAIGAGIASWLSFAAHR